MATTTIRMNQRSAIKLLLNLPAAFHRCVGVNARIATAKSDLITGTVIVLIFQTDD
jgi:hypothetical protein